VKVESYICDWFAPYCGDNEVVLVITMPDDAKLDGFDNFPEIWEAFYEAFKDDREIDEDACVTEYIYEVCAMRSDVSQLILSSATCLHIKLAT
jgi:hypothetical protein